MNKIFKPGLTDAPAQDFDIQVKEMLSECFPTRPVGRVLLVNPPESTSEMFRYAAAINSARRAVIEGGRSLS